ncbi:TSUP family transporter [Corynebacterium poyangense]|uniref:Probable membrane transporter protein n=1 Tax=Corynebacterium poyangense TaxID=2684405 RepID=A0A7H0SLA2_9CORY|nr:TSUP family transporter [Corynebacterium poyangense]QNQ89327.1 TSUP family transporter [Corynebacterium poyangense]
MWLLSGIDLSSLGILLGGAALAGWADAVIGGGGLILIPLLMSTLPHMAPVVILASNKVAAVSGTTSAAVVMVRRTRPPALLLVRYASVAVVCSALGAFAATLVNKNIMRPIIIVLLVAVGIFVMLRPQFGLQRADNIPGQRSVRGILAVLAVGIIAGYDGIFGPGTGMFLIMAFTALLSQDFLQSAAMAKVVNTATNFGALVVFGIGGHIWWALGFSLAVANILGAQLGARTVLGGGAKLVRIALLCMVLVLAAYLSYEQLAGNFQ